MKKIVSFLLIFAMTVLLTPGEVSVAAAAPKVQKSITVKVGSTKQIEVTGTTVDSKSFTSTKTSIATVSKAGKVKGIKYGSAIIKTKVTYGTETKTLKTVVTVVKKTGFTAAKVYQSMIELMDKYPEGTPWTNANRYVWHAVPGITYEMYGCAGFAAILSDAAFGKKTEAKEVRSPSASRIRVGDIFPMENDTHSVIVLKVETDGFIIAEGNYNSSIHWGRKISKLTVPNE